MKIRTWSALALSLCLTTSLFAGHDKKKTATSSTDEKAMMDAWMKSMVPGAAHKKLEPFVGTFDVKMKSWMAPGAPAQESTGVSTNTWALGNRYVEQRFVGTFMEMPFEGIGYTGYDNTGKNYFGTWMDSMSTGMMTSTGSVSTDGKIFKFTGSMLDPMTGKMSKVKETITLKTNDEHIFEMWGAAPNGKMFKMMELVYTRQ